MTHQGEALPVLAFALSELRVIVFLVADDVEVQGLLVGEGFALAADRETIDTGLDIGGSEGSGDLVVVPAVDARGYVMEEAFHLSVKFVAGALREFTHRCPRTVRLGYAEGS